MVDIVPFKGLLYNQQKTGPLTKVIAPPYDVISPEQQDVLYQQNPFNVVRLILAKEFPTDTENDNRYTRSAAVFNDWTQREILSRDPAPAFYVYRQDYTFAGKTLSRMGFFARVKIEEFSAGNICPHEFTLAKAKADRARLIRACRANFSPIFGLFSDAEGTVDGLLESATQEEPLGKVDDGKVVHHLWRFQDSAQMAAISKHFQEKKIYIADGHHRYETALGYYQEFGQQVPGSEYVMMFLTNLDSDAMSIFPIHRLIRVPGKWDQEGFLAKLRERFDVEPLPGKLDAASVGATLDQMDGNAMGYCVYFGKGSGYRVKVRSAESLVPLLDSDEPPELQVLDVAQLHVGILRSLLGIDTRRTEHQSHISYKVDIKEAIKRVDAGEFDLAFFMNPTRIEQVRSLAEKGIRLPQKATFFYPKLLSGLVINPFES